MTIVCTEQIFGREPAGKQNRPGVMRDGIILFFINLDL